MTHHQRIFDYMERFGSISPMEAFRDLGETKLSTRIGEMRQTLRDFCPDWLAYFLEGWPLRLVGCGVIFAALYAGAAVMQALGA